MLPLGSSAGTFRPIQVEAGISIHSRGSSRMYPVRGLQSGEPRTRCSLSDHAHSWSWGGLPFVRPRDDDGRPISGVRRNVAILAGWNLQSQRANLAPYRYLHFLVIAFFVVRFLPRNWPGLEWHIFRPAILCGQQSLETFCAGIFLAFA